MPPSSPARARAAVAILATLSALVGFGASFVGTEPTPATPELARELLRELVEIDTTDRSGDTTRAAEAMTRRLLDAGFPESDVRLLGPHPAKGNLVARLRGTGGGEPILLLAHLDVVEARREDWSVDPFTFLEREGYFYGRGTTDDKAMAAIWIANLIGMKREAFEPDRDVVVALTADEEGGDHNGVVWLLEHHRELLDAAFCLNEGGGGQMKDGERFANSVQLSEKVYRSFRLEVTDPGGHSSRPRRDNAIYRLSEALVRLSRHEFPVEVDEITSAYFEKMASLETGPVAFDLRAVAESADARAAERLSRSPYYNALLRTTCVATELDAGHAENALPQTARATLNCRMFPGSDPASVETTLRGVIGDPRVRLVPLQPARPSPPSPLDPEVLGAIERVTESMWPGVPVVPTMATGATDGLYLRNAGIPTYGVSGLFNDVDDVRAHGKDERIGIEAFHEGREFLDRLVRDLASR